MPLTRPQRADAPRRTDRPTALDVTPSRRAFMVQLAAVVAGLTACDSKTAPSQTATPGAGAASSRSRPMLPTLEPRMRVRVVKARGRERVIGIGEPKQRLLLACKSIEDELAVRGAIQVALGSEQWEVIDERGDHHVVPGLHPLEIKPHPRDEQSLRLGTIVYPGTMRLVARDDVDAGAIDVINLVMMEDYLPGVVTAELYDHWKLQTRAAQAIAARSFAASENQIFRNRRPFDVTATASSQVYVGRVRHRESLEAVEMTRGVVLASGGLLVPGYYSSCCGGLAADAVDAIGPHPANDVAPLHGRGDVDVCVDAKVASWTVKRPVGDLTYRLNAYGNRRSNEDLAGLDEISAIETAASNTHGRPINYTVSDRTGKSVEIDADELRRAANASSMGIPAPQHALWSSHFEVSIAGGTVTFHGRGFGHGVGLCQHGAEKLARDGKAYAEILSWYYPGAELVKAY